MPYPDNLPPQAQTVPASYGELIVASGTEFVASRAIHCNLSETITVQFRDRAVTTDLVVNAGSVYPYSIKKVTVGAGAVVIR